MDLLGGVLLDSGLFLAAVAAVSLVFPLRFLGVRTRKQALLLLAVSFISFVSGVFVPAPETRVVAVRSRIDEFAPAFEFSEFHSTLVDAPPDRVDAAIRQVRPEEIRLYKTLMTIRRLDAGPADKPILETFTKGWFPTLSDEPGREIVFGHGASPIGPQHRTPLVAIVMNFRISDAGPGRSLVTTETRVDAAPGRVRRGFAAYWRIIRPGSALIRRMWLRAIRARAER